MNIDIKTADGEEIEFGGSYYDGRGTEHRVVGIRLTDYRRITKVSLSCLVGKVNDVFERIADLIDRPTCLDLVEHKQDPFIPGKRMVDGYFHCSDCGWDGQIWEHIGFGDMLAYEAVHCPKCGAIIERRA
jgi:hypothetical protein